MKFDRLWDGMEGVGGGHARFFLWRAPQVEDLVADWEGG